jgi:hypothetical protein
MTGAALSNPAGRVEPGALGLVFIAVMSLSLHLLVHPAYGFHRDELLYLAMGDHLQPLMPFPPLIAWLAQLARALPLELLTAVRLLPALAAATLPVLAAMICHMLGGSRRAQFVAALAVLVAPLFLRAGTLFQPVVFEQVWWCLATLGLAHLLAGRAREWWLVVGAALGLAALTKFSVAFLAVGVLVAIVFSPLRQDFRARWLWLGAAVGLALALPSVLGQIAWDWPFLEQSRALREHQLGNFDRLEFVVGQSLMLGPGAPLWLIGLVALLVSQWLRPFRALGLLAATVFLLLLFSGGKDYYFGPVHPLLIAAAATILGGWLEKPLVFGGVSLWLVAGGLVLLPMGVPLLAPRPMAQYAEALGITEATETNYGGTLPLPQDYADMIGWPDLADTVSAVFHRLSPQERGVAAILGNNYGRTGAVALFGRGLGLPYPVSRHGDFYFWGARGASGEVTILMGGTREQWEQYWGDVTDAARTSNSWGVDEEQSVPIFVARRPRLDLRALFAKLGPEWR